MLSYFILPKYQKIQEILFSLVFLSFSICHFLKIKRRSRQTVVIVFRKRVPNNRVTVSDFLGREDPRGKEHHVDGRQRRKREPKGFVAEVTVPTASSRKANCGRPAHFVVFGYTMCSRSRALSLE